MGRAGVFVIALVVALGAAGCGSDPKPSVFDVLCHRGRPDGHVDLEYRWREGRRQILVSSHVIQMARQCCPDWKALAHASKSCATFAKFDGFPDGYEHQTVDLGRRASDDDRSVVIAFFRKYGAANAI